MRIKEVNVRKYGPVDDFRLICDDIQVIYGRNEAGKTALVDAITTALFQKKSVFPGQDRFKEDKSFLLSKNVTVILEHSGKNYFFPGPLKFEQLINLPHYHLAGLFIIRAGDLSLRKDKKWEDRVKEFLSGIPANIERIKEKIGEEVDLTPSGDWSDRQPARKKTKIKEKEERVEDLLRAIEKLKLIRQKEKILKDKTGRRDNLKRKLEDIRALKSYKLHKRIKDAYLNWRRNKSFFLDYQRYLNDDLELWLKNEREKESFTSKINSCKYEIEAILKDLETMDEESLHLKKNREDLLNKKRMIAAFSIDKDMTDVSFSQRNISNKTSKLLLYITLGVILSVIGGILLLLSKSFSGWSLVYFVSLITGIYLLINSYFLNKLKMNLKKKKEEILEKGKKIWPECGSLNEIFTKCNSLDLEISKIESKLDYIERKKEEKLLSLKKKKEELKSVEKQLHFIDENIKKLREKTGLSSFSQLEKKLAEKREIELEIKSLEKILADSTGTDDLLAWEREAEKEVPEPDVEEEDLRIEGKIEEELSRLNEEIQSLKEEIASFVQGELGRLQIKKITDIWTELEEVESTLRHWYQDREAALLAWEILDKIGQDTEKVLLDTIMDEKKGVSFYFNLITSGRYKKVNWKENSLYVEHSDGKIYPVNVLSSGTQDQLFFSLRLGILKRGLPEGTFILLDDAFLTSDTTRREQQVRVCYQLVREGWQIFYFTVDEGLRDLFCRICKIKPVIL